MKEKFVVNAIRQLVINKQESSCEFVNFLVNASSMEQAKEMIENHMKSNQMIQTNSSGAKFYWKFIEIESVNPIIFDDRDIMELQIKSYDNLDVIQNKTKQVGLEASTKDS